MSDIDYPNLVRTLESEIDLLNSLLEKAWDAVPEDFRPVEGDDLAAAIKALAAALLQADLLAVDAVRARADAAEAEVERLRSLLDTMDRTGLEDAYRHGRVELAEELATLVGELPTDSTGVWHYVMGALDIVTNKAEVLR